MNEQSNLKMKCDLFMSLFYGFIDLFNFALQSMVLADLYGLYKLVGDENGDIQRERERRNLLS